MNSACRFTAAWRGAAVLLLLCSQTYADDPVLLRGPYLQSANPTSIIVCWRTEIPVAGRVRYGTSENNLDLFADGKEPLTDHEVRLTGLTPATKYYYRVEAEQAVLAVGPDFHFHTPPPETSTAPFRFWVLGDCGTGAYSIAARQVRDAFAPVHAQRPADFWVMLGDNAYGQGTDEEYQGAVFNFYHPYLQQLPLWSCIGNHETYAGFEKDGLFPYDRIFVFPQQGECGGEPSGTERYFSWNYANMHFVSLDGFTVSRDKEGPMANWLRADLESNTRPWVIALWHNPPYSHGSHNSDFEHGMIEMRQSFVPILEEYGVDMVMCGHSHNYERSFLIDGHYGMSDELTADHIKDEGDGSETGNGPYQKPDYAMKPHQGTVYVVAGSSGQNFGGMRDHPIMIKGIDGLGALVVDVDDRRMDVRFLRETVKKGALPVFGDWFTIIKGGTNTPPPAPGRPAVLALDDSRALVHWTDRSHNEQQYHVQLRTEEAHDFSDVATLAPDATWAELTGLVPGVSYVVRVKVTNAAGAGVSVVCPFSHPDSPVPQPGPAEHWRFRHFGMAADAGPAADALDADLDGTINLVEYALGTLPNRSYSMPLLMASRTPEGSLSLTFQRHACPDIIYAVEFSDHLHTGAWVPQFISAGEDNVPGPVTVTDIESPPARRRFVRMRITRPAGG